MEIKQRKIRKGKISFPHREEIKRRYISGESSLVLSREFGVTHGAIGGFLRREGIIRKSIWTEFNRIPLDQDAFAVITPESAYWIGFIMADGCIQDGKYLT